MVKYFLCGLLLSGFPLVTKVEAEDINPGAPSSKDDKEKAKEEFIKKMGAPMPAEAAMMPPPPPILPVNIDEERFRKQQVQDEVRRLVQEELKRIKAEDLKKK